MVLTLYNLHSLGNTTRKAPSLQKHLCNWNSVVMKYFVELHYTHSSVPLNSGVKSSISVRQHHSARAQSSATKYCSFSEKTKPLHTGNFLQSNDCCTPAIKAEYFQRATAGWGWGHRDFKHVETHSISLSPPTPRWRKTGNHPCYAGTQLIWEETQVLESAGNLN